MKPLLLIFPQEIITGSDDGHLTRRTSGTRIKLITPELWEGDLDDEGVARATRSQSEESRLDASEANGPYPPLLSKARLPRGGGVSDLTNGT